jgi:mRNA interferase HicA
MTGNEFVRKVKALGKRDGVIVRLDACRGKGSHRAFYKTDRDGRVRLVVVPQGKDIPRGTLLAIIEQSGVSREEFLAAV